MEVTRETPTRTFDAIVVGTGATGGWAAKQLTEAGMDVLVLDAGPMPEPSRDFAHHEMPWDRPNRGLSFDRRSSQPVPTDRLPLVWSRNADNPYTTPPDKPFTWVRSRIVGGRTLHWSRAAHRLSDFDFKAASRDGYGDDWPISYAEIAPYYDKVEEHIGVSAYAEGYPQLPDGKFLPGMNYNCVEQQFRKTALRMGLPATHRRIAQLSRPHKGRPACHFCGACREGCDIGAMFNSIVSTLPPADATKRMTLRPDSVVRAVLMGKDGKARGVSYIDRVSKLEYEAKAKHVIVAASTLESVRILWNSHKDGLGNSSGALGHYIMDQVAGASVSGIFPQLRNSPPRNDDGKSSGAFIANFRNIESRHPKFIRGYCMSMSGGQSERPSYALEKKGYGAALKQSIRADYPAMARIYMSAGDMLPRYENFAGLDPKVKDAWGIPVLNISCTFGDNERAIWEDGTEMMKQIFTEAGGEILAVGQSISTPGGLIHEVGGTRMGVDPKTSVLDPYCRMHDVPNVYVFGGSPFVTTGSYHPTLTMMALTVRGCERLTEQAKRREA
ncbi:MAG: GMC family oxidoreductase [Bryobacterales bacterium]|nr:GMC family oxidoreductase [Acidobacteriota bacterium]MCB9383588.1 GMC family oxidoreductase [Bryobacterales bacterium]